MRTHRWHLVPAVALLLGCGADAVEPFVPVGDPDASGLYWQLTLNHTAVTISTVRPYDTLQLVAVPRDAQGNPLSGLGQVEYSTGDPSRVLVTREGLVRGLTPGGNVSVSATLTAGGVTHQASVRVTVSGVVPPPFPAQLSIDPPDGTTWPVNGNGELLTIDGSGNVFNNGLKFLTPLITDSMGNPVFDADIVATSSDTTVVQALASGTSMFLSGVAPGRARIAAAVTAFGVTVTDTMDFTITMPVFGVVRIVQQPTGRGGPLQPTFVSPEITISPGGTVIWANVSGVPVDIVFDQPANVGTFTTVSCEKAGAVDPGGTGDVTPFGEPQDPALPLSGENCRSRSFPVPGVYPYHSTRTGATGRVVVTDGVTTP